VRVLSRYLLRQLALPFIFGLLALTGIMLLNLIGRKFGSLVGKGLPWSVIGEVFLLSVPFLLAMTLPLAVLAATLYAFGQLANDSEITAMRAGGVSTVGMLRPVLAWAVVMVLVTFGFVDQVLPRSNARLRNLYFDIARKKPTFSMVENVINKVPSSQYFLRASRIDPGSGRLRSVSIYDVGQAERRRIIYADSGLMGYTKDGRDLVLKLFHGSVQQVTSADRPLFEHTTFTTQEIVFKDVFDQLERSEDQLDRGEREMTTCELMGVVDSSSREIRDARTHREDLTRSDLQVLLGRPPEAVPAPTGTASQGPYRGAYCGLFAAVSGAIGRGTQKPGPAAQGTASSPVPNPTPAAAAAAAPAPTAAPAPAARLSDIGTVTSVTERERNADRRADRYRVEIFKKWSLSFASIPFVLIAVAMALRFPRGGMGLVLGGGMFVYSVFYVGLTAGETLADRGYAPPALAMFSPNIILGAIALVGLLLVHRGGGSSRGGEFPDLLQAFRRRRRSVTPAVGATP
jgi:lipopolysaccharide export system permease protein